MARVCYVFDMDGVLMDSKDAVFEAYERAGVIMPEDAWGKPWQDWLIRECNGDEKHAQKVHTVKNQMYLETLEFYARWKPARHLAAQLIAADEMVRVITGASIDACEIAFKFLDLPIKVLEGTYMRTIDKVKWLSRTAAANPLGIYFDDRRDVTVPPGWQRCTVS